MAQFNAAHSRQEDNHLENIMNAIESWNGAPRKRISGIANQGATCYLNTLLQTLLHTPDLTSRLFRMAKTTDVSKLKRILRELLALFSNLFRGDGTAISARSLTDSFGWTSDEVMVHQDIQELNRLLFEQLENNLRNTSERNLISDLYKGVLRTTIKCLDCGHISERNDEFQDVNLSVSECDSVEKALAHHTQTEKLSGENQYFCENCKRRVDATKASKFTELPPVLTLSLSRFYFDPKTMESCKLDKMCSFPLLLDMSAYLSGTPNSPVTYDLFSIVIHAGAAAGGGHYHAYIKDPYGYTGGNSEGRTTPKVCSRRIQCDSLEIKQLCKFYSEFSLTGLKLAEKDFMHYCLSLENLDYRTRSNEAEDPIEQTLEVTERLNLSSLKDRQAIEIEQLQENTNHASNHQRALRTLDNSSLGRARAQSHQRPLPPFNTMAGHNIEPLLQNAVTIKQPLTSCKGSAGNSLKKQHHLSDHFQVPPGVKMKPANIHSKDGIDRARSRKNMQIVSSAATNTNSTLRENPLRSQLKTKSPLGRKQLANAYDRFVGTMLASLNSAEMQARRLSSTECRQTGFSKEGGSNQSQFQPPSINKSPNLRRKISTRTSSSNTINIDVSDGSDHTLNPPIKGNSTSAHFGDRITPSQIEFMCPRKSMTAKSYQGTWRSKLFLPAVASQSQSSSCEASKIEELSRTLADADFQAQDNENSPIKTSSLNVKDSFSLNKQQETVEKIQEESESMKEPCETPRVKQEGGNPVVYGKWFDFNDEVVTEVYCDSFKNVFQGLECAYMLFYKRTGQSLS